MGAASSNSTVKVTVGNKTYTVKSNRNGLWSVKTGTLKVGTKISATVTNSFDKVSARTYVTVKNQKIAKPSHCVIICGQVTRKNNKLVIR